MGNRVIISDLDGTISDPSHRIKLYQQKEYKAFNKAGKDDAPLENTCNLLRSVSGEGADVVIVTARGLSLRIAPLVLICGAAKGLPVFKLHREITDGHKTHWE